jgi:hypothetical protein
LNRVRGRGDTRLVRIRFFIGQCETTLVQGPEIDERDSSGGKST